MDKNLHARTSEVQVELREMLTEAVRNTQAELKRRPKADKDRG